MLSSKLKNVVIFGHEFFFGMKESGANFVCVCANPYPPIVDYIFFWCFPISQSGTGKFHLLRSTRSPCVPECSHVTYSQPNNK